jgi:Protein of unknown function DUF262/Protein of unknown function (DUF1524)
VQAQALTPAEIFGYHVRYVVPLFQRPYVWNRRDQWEPLWDDVRAVAQRLLDGPPAFRPTLIAPHFLGAIVVEQAPTTVGSVAVYHVIDGQQRLTTLQLLLDAARLVARDLADRDLDADPDADPDPDPATDVKADADLLQRLVRNDPAVRRDDDDLKVWPTLADRDAYRAALADVAGAAPVAQAHAYFVEVISDWVFAAAPAPRVAALTRALTTHLRAVVIHLDPGDNAQTIFETLNHRGAPLLAADLIKNLVFRLADARGLDVVGLYQRYWSDLDGPFWRAYVRRGRQVVPRIDIFVNYWLVMRLAREVRTDEIFAGFRDHLDTVDERLEDTLAALARDADRYATALTDEPNDPVAAQFCYRVFDALDTGALMPVYLWLMRWSPQRLPVEQRDRALRALESWAVRRWLCGLPTKDTTNVVLELLSDVEDAGPEVAGEVTEAFLLRQRISARVWPADQVVRKALKTAAVDGRPLRPRLRMVLEAIEDHQRTEKSEGQACERGLTVEHVMPLAWRQHWTGGADPATAVLRDTLVHTLGNLTLARWKLNSDLGNLPWTDGEAAAQGLGGTGKRSELAKHSLLRMNADLVTRNPDAWNQDAITERTATLATVIIAVWPRAVPTSPAPPAIVSPAEAPSTVDLDEPVPADAGTGSKYTRLTEFLRQQTADPLPLTFQQVVDVLGAALPPSARTSIPYWSRNNAALGKAISAGGYRPTNVDLWNERLILTKGRAERRARTSRRYVRRRPTPS